MSLKRVSHRRDDALSRTDWAEVERLLARHYYSQAGFEVDHCGTGSRASRYDGGIDLKLRRNGEYIVVQCKHWNAMKVPHNDVHQLIGLMVNEGATGAILVTSGEFTRAAIEAATKHGHVQLVDGDDLREMLGALPEPQNASMSRFTEMMSSDIGRHASTAAKYAGGRLLDAAEHRIRGSTRTHGSSGVVGVTAKVLLLKALLALVVPILFLLLFLGFVNHALWSVTRALAPHTVSAPVPAQVPAAQASQVQVPITSVQEPAPAPRAVWHEPTAAEIREQQRKAAEAMKIIEATTPELYEGRPGQIRGQ
jgi:restriction system protein